MSMIPVTRHGFSVIFAATLALLVVGAVGSMATPHAWWVVAVVWGCVISFFRDPARNIKRQANILYAAADGRVTEVTELEHHDLVGGPCHRIRIFLSLFNAHINRMPCAAEVRSVTLKPGKFLNAMKSRSAEENESNTLLLTPEAPFAGPMVVRQIAGMIARTIVCRAEVGQPFRAGQRFGMIKFGSGTELVVLKQEGLKVLVKVGDNVKAGLTEMMK
ncbi:MAG: phosphatidylserine decarboxylase, partial [Planctomycetes bacterium]|nr:phosphatidylserine decarboxylase [Planctomycetota bacterium]